MNYKLLLIKDLINEIPPSEWEDVKNELLSILLFSDMDSAVGPVDHETGLSEYEAKLIQKLAKQTEKLQQLYRDNNRNEND